MVLAGAIESNPTPNFLYDIRLNIDSRAVAIGLKEANKKIEDKGEHPEMLEARFVENRLQALKNEVEKNSHEYTSLTNAVLNYLIQHEIK